MQMVFKLFICGLLSTTVIQAFPLEPVTTADELYQDKASKCDKKLSWYRNTTEKIQELFEKHYNEYKNFKKTNNLNEGNLTVEYRDFEEKVTEALDRYHKDIKKLCYIRDEATHMVFCAKEIQWFRLMDQNLTKMATNIKTNVLHVLDTVGVSKETRDKFDQNLSRIVNFLFIIDIAKNLLLDVNSLATRALVKTVQGIPLQKSNPLETNDQPVEEAKEIDEEYREVLEDTEEDRMLNDDVANLEDDTRIHAAEERIKMEEESEQLKDAEEREIEAEGAAESEAAEDLFDFEIPAVIRA
ncbi:uncharacterized protein LOC131667104 [Phymastichus coffea]|uniref:uncharacterized protein LOC131667104 n=1 Tax=Phymastichus coffea TaxID=108790 RepID=UPI00273C8D92|nr:uncharacterized protein LOC131667104 [Phymastichus coffea]